MRWEFVRILVRCAYGCEIPRGEIAAIGRRGFALCRSCARNRYNMRPPRSMRPGRPDVDVERDGKTSSLPAGDR